MEQTRWAILGPGTISGDFARALPAAQHGALHAVGSSVPARAETFAREFGAPVSGTYAEIIARDDVDAVYIGTVHTTHAELAIAALEAGKAVLCEKPVSPTPEETAAVLEVAAASGRPFMEAFKYRFGPLAEAVRALIGDGAIGRIERLEAALGFANPTRTGRLFDPALAGGAILDVGCYPVSLAVGIARWAAISEGRMPEVVSVAGSIGDTGVDEWAELGLRFDAFEAVLRTSIVSSETRTVVLHGSSGSIEVPDIWGSRVESASTLTVRVGGEARTIEVPTISPMAAEADAVSQAIADGRSEVPEMTWVETTTIARVLEDWRRGI